MNKENAKFCHGCGTVILAANFSRSAVEPEIKLCAACQAENKPNAKFCLKCGYNFSQATPVAAQSSAEQPIRASSTGGCDAGKEVAEADAGKSCPTCNTQLKSDAKFCGKCGFNFSAQLQATESAAPISSVLTPAPDEAMAKVIASVSIAHEVEGDPTADKFGEGDACPSCNSQLKPNAKFCSKCGFSFSVKQQAPENVAQIDPAPIQMPDEVTAKATAFAPFAQEAVCAQHEPIRAAAASAPLPTKRGHVILIGALAVLLCVTAAGGYWWFWLKSPAEAQEIAQGETDLLAGAASSALATAAIVAVSTTPVVATVEELSVAANDQTSLAEPPKPEQKPVIAKPPTTIKPRRETIANTRQALPVPEYSPAPTPDVKLDSQSETMLTFGENMFASKNNSGALSAANQVLKKYPGNPRATRLKNKAQAEIERQMQEVRNQMR